MRRVRFQIRAPELDAAANRLDIACFVGLVHRRPSLPPPEVVRWLDWHGFLPALVGNATWADDEPPARMMTRAEWHATKRKLFALEHLPVPIESFEMFASLFEVQGRATAISAFPPPPAPEVLDGAPDLSVSVESPTRARLEWTPVAGAAHYEIDFADEDGEVRHREVLGDVRTATIDFVPAKQENVRVFGVGPAPGRTFVGRARIFGANAVDAYLVAAVRSFFTQGGRRCIVVRAGDPLTAGVEADAASLVDRLEALLPVRPGADRSTWRGIELLRHLPEASYVALPDLPDLVGGYGRPAKPPPSVRGALGFVECGTQIAPPADTRAAALTAARIDENRQLKPWVQAIQRAATFVRRWRRDVQLVASVPLFTADHPASTDLVRAFRDYEELGEDGAPPRSINLWGSLENGGIGTAFLQLVYPWLDRRDATRLPEALEPPDGTMVGLLARRTLQTGAFRPVFGSTLLDVHRVVPNLTERQRTERRPYSAATGEERALDECVTLFAPGPTGLEAVSDVTAATSDPYRTASINRLVMVWRRALQQAGEDLVFQPNGERVWSQVRSRLTAVGNRLFELGALSGEDARRAFDVRCDRGTMSQRDIDAGRLVAEVRFTAAMPIRLVVVTLSLEGGAFGQIARTAS